MTEESFNRLDMVQARALERLVTICVAAIDRGADVCCRNFAYAEVRSIIVRLLWTFDIELADKSVDWKNQKGFFVWRTKLEVKLVERV